MQRTNEKKKTKQRLANYTVEKCISFACFIVGVQLTLIFFLLHNSGSRQITDGSIIGEGKMKINAEAQNLRGETRQKNEHPLKFREKNKWKFDVPKHVLNITSQCLMRPFVIGGFTGSGTRLPMRLLQRAGVFMGPDSLITSDGDTLAWIASMADKDIHQQIDHLLRKTGSTNYAISDISDVSIVAPIRREFEVHIYNKHSYGLFIQCCLKNDYLIEN